MTERRLAEGLLFPPLDREPPSITMSLWACSTHALKPREGKVTETMWPAAGPEGSLYASSERHGSFYLKNEYFIELPKQSAHRCDAYSLFQIQVIFSSWVHFNFTLSQGNFSFQGFVTTSY